MQAIEARVEADRPQLVAVSARPARQTWLLVSLSLSARYCWRHLSRWTHDQKIMLSTLRESGSLRGRGTEQ